MKGVSRFSDFFPLACLGGRRSSHHPADAVADRRTASVVELRIVAVGLHPGGLINGSGRKCTKCGTGSSLLARSRLPAWGRTLLAWLRELPQVTSLAGREEILRISHVLIQILD